MRIYDIRQYHIGIYITYIRVKDTISLYYLWKEALSCEVRCVDIEKHSDRMHDRLRLIWNGVLIHH